MIPSAKIENLDKAPPENMLNRPRMPPSFWLNKSASTSGLMPGVGMCVPNRKTMSASTRKPRRRPRSPYLAPALPIPCVAKLHLASGHRAACSFNCCFGTRGRVHTLKRHLAGDITGLEHLDKLDGLTDHASLLERLHVNFINRQVLQI